jgi:hypothetical protein
VALLFLDLWAAFLDSIAMCNEILCQAADRTEIPSYSFLVTLAVFLQRYYRSSKLFNISSPGCSSCAVTKASYRTGFRSSTVKAKVQNLNWLTTFPGVSFSEGFLKTFISALEPFVFGLHRCGCKSCLCSLLP